MLTRSSLALILAAAAWLPSANAQINATFVGNSMRYCVNTAGGFDANLKLITGGNISSALDVTYLTFNADGTGSSHGKTLVINKAATGTGASPVTQFDASCTFTYAPDAAHGGIVISNLVCTSTSIAGPPQQTQSSNGTRRARLLGDPDGDTLMLAVDTDPEVETLTNLTTGVVTQRICHRDGMRFFTKLPDPTL
jgi:hypothetical protein